MILRRVIDHVKNQEWTAIGLDFLIVVVGVFVGLQVSNWNDVRRERAATASLLVRLEDDFREIAPDVHVVAETLALNQGGTGKLILALRTEPDMPAAEDFEEILTAPMSLPNLPPVTPTYMEMISSGGLSQIPDTALRRALSRYAENASDYEKMYSNALDKLLETSGGPTMVTAVQVNPESDTSDDAAAFASVDWEKLRLAEPQLQAIQIYQANLARIAGRQDEDVKQILARLEAQNK